MSSTSNNVVQTNFAYQIARRLRQANTIAFLGQALSQAGNAIVQETTNNLKSLAHILGNIRDGRISSENLSQIIVDINSNLEQGLGNSSFSDVGSQVTNMNMFPANYQTSSNYISTAVSLPPPNSHIATTQNRNPNRNAKSVKFTIVRFNCTEVGCPEVFERMNALEHHLKSSHRINHFRCFQANCGRSFSAKKQLEDHLKKDHSNCRAWNCKQCNRKFEKQSPDRFKGLQDHFIKNHYLGVFSCANCGTTFECQAKAIKHCDQRDCLLSSQTNPRQATSVTDPTDPYAFAPQSPIHINILPRVFQQINNNQGMGQSFAQSEQTFSRQNEPASQSTAEPEHSTGRIDNSSNKAIISSSAVSNNEKEDSRHNLRNK